MLVLARRKDEGVTVKTPAGDLRIVVTGLTHGRVVLGFEAPRSWSIERDDMKVKRGSEG